MVTERVPVVYYVEEPVPEKDNNNNTLNQPHAKKSAPKKHPVQKKVIKAKNGKPVKQKGNLFKFFNKK